MNTMQIFSEAGIHALGWTLLHAIWEGSLIALGVWLIRMQLPQAHQRYVLAYGGLMAVLACSAVTFWLVYPQQAMAAGASERLYIWSVSGLHAESAQDVLSTWADRLEAYHPLIVALWISGFVVFLSRLAGGWWWTYRLRKRYVAPVSSELEALFERIKKQAGWRRSVQLLQSVYIKTPLALGHFKPVVILPLAVVNQLSMEETEAILAHELAHIIRRDWLFNIVQAVAETLFYYHPAVWWLSAMARQERENACDDFAVRITKRPVQFAKALLRVQEIAAGQATPVLAMGLMGHVRKRPLLLLRIQRLIQPQQQKIELMEKWIATAVVAALMALWGVRTVGAAPVMINSLQAMVEDRFDWMGAQNAPEAVSDTLPPQPKRIRKIVQDDGKQKVEIEVQNEQITRLAVDGKEIPPSEYGKYEDVTSKMLEIAPIPPVPPVPPAPPAPAPPGSFWEMPAPAPPGAPRPPGMVWEAPAPGTTVTTLKDPQGNTVIRVEQAGEPLEIVVKGDQVLMNGRPLEQGQTIALDAPGEQRVIVLSEDIQSMPGGTVYFYNQPTPSADAPRYIVEERVAMSPEYNYSWQWSAADMERLEKEQKELQREMKKQRKEMRKSMKEAQESMEKAQVKMENAQREQEIAIVRMQGVPTPPPPPPVPPFPSPEGNSFAESLTASLMANGLIKDPENYDFELSTAELKVNGQKQSEKMHQTYLEMYAHHFGRPLEPKSVIRIENRQ